MSVLNTSGFQGGGDSCLCDNTLRTDPATVEEPSAEACNIDCPGDPSQKCGAAESLSWWKKNAQFTTDFPPPGKYKMIGCYNAFPSLGPFVESEGRWSAVGGPDRCEDICVGSIRYALYQDTCYCGTTIEYSSRLKAESDCTYACMDGQNQCGGMSRVNMYLKEAPCFTVDSPLRVANPGLESGMTSWTSMTGGPGTVKWTVRTDKVNAVGGSRYARIDFSTAGGSIRLKQFVPIYGYSL